jgi:hypothetical protein
VVAFTQTVGKTDWDPDSCSWRCSTLGIPGAELDAVYTADGTIDKAWYQVLPDLRLVRWVHGTPPPDRLTLSIKLTKDLSTQELTSFWKKVAIVLPVLASFLSAVLALFAKPAGPTKSSETHIWTIKGAIERSAEYADHDVVATVVPPDLRLNPDYTFEGTMPIETGADGNLILPQLIVTLKNKVGFSQAVVHLVNSGQALPLNAEDFDQRTDHSKHVIELHKPIQFHRFDQDPPFSPSPQTPIPKSPAH